MSDEINFYSKEAKTYNKRFTSFIGKWMNKTQQRTVHEFLFKDGLVLDLACGTGRFLNNMDCNSVGADGSNMIRLAVGNRVKCDASRLSFKTNSMSFIICVNAWNHFSNYKKIIKEVSRVLKHDGLFLFNFSNLHSPVYPVGLYVNLRHKAIGKNVYTRWDTFKHVKRTCLHAGLIPIERHGMTRLGRFCYSVFVVAKNIL